MADLILVLNAGSSSLKFCVYEAGGAAELSLLLKGQVDGIGSRPSLRARNAGGQPVVDQTYPLAEIPDVGVAVVRLGVWLRERFPGAAPSAVGHRVAHGGADFPAPVAVDEGVLTALERYIPLAPMHQPHNLSPIRAIRKEFPTTLQVACFDTAFHRGDPRSRSGLPCRSLSTARAFAAMDFTDSRTSTSRGPFPASRPILLTGGWWLRISGAAPACVP